jgi:hypothetical protein
VVPERATQTGYVVRVPREPDTLRLLAGGHDRANVYGAAVRLRNYCDPGQANGRDDHERAMHQTTVIYDRLLSHHPFRLRRSAEVIATRGSLRG